MGEGIAGMWFEERGERLTVMVISLHAEDGERLMANVWVISRDGWGDRRNMVWGKGRVFDGEGNFVARRGRWAFDSERLSDFGVWTLRVFERLRESAWEIESAWETERVFERLRETVWVVGVWNLHVAKIFHISGLANQVKRVLKARVSIESRVFKTQDDIVLKPGN